MGRTCCVLRDRIGFEGGRPIVHGWRRRRAQCRAPAGRDREPPRVPSDVIRPSYDRRAHSRRRCSRPDRRRPAAASLHSRRAPSAKFYCGDPSINHSSCRGSSCPVALTFLAAFLDKPPSPWPPPSWSPPPLADVAGVSGGGALLVGCSDMTSKGCCGSAADSAPTRHRETNLGAAA